MHHSSVSSNITLLYFFSSNIICFVQKEPIKSANFWDFRELRSKFVKFLMWTLKRQVNSSSDFAWFFIVMTHNSSAAFKLIHVLLWMKRSHQSPNFEIFKCSGENLPYSSWHCPSHKSVFLQTLHHSSVSWKTTPLDFFRSNVIYFAQKEPLKVEILRISSAQVKIHQILVNKRTLSKYKFGEISREQLKVWNFYFDGFLLSKSYKVSAKKNKRVISHDI